MKHFGDLYGLYFDDSEFAHVGRSKRDGAKVGSGRYPLGSGKNPNQHDKKSKSSSLFNKIFGNKTNNNSSEFDYSYKLDTKSNPDDYKLLRPQTRNLYEELTSEIGGVESMTSEKLNYKLPGNKRESVRTNIKMKGDNYDEDEIFDLLEKQNFRIYEKTYDKDCNLKSLYACHKPFTKGEDDQDVLIDIEPGSTFKEPKHSNIDHYNIRINKNREANDNLKKYLYEEDVDLYKKFDEKMYVHNVEVNNDWDNFTNITFYVSPKKDQKKQVEEINNIIEKNGYTGYGYNGKEQKLTYNENLVDGLDYMVTIPTKNKDMITIVCPSVEGYAEEVGRDITNEIVD